VLGGAFFRALARIASRVASLVARFAARPWLPLVLLVGFAVLKWPHNPGLTPAGPDGNYYYQIARNVEEGKGFRYLLDGLNAERILVATESIGDGRWFIRKAVEYANSRVVFGRTIGRNQGVQFPIARAYAEIEAADLMCRRAAALFGAGHNAGEAANIAKLLASEACFKAGDVAMQTHGGFGFAREYDIERKWREARLYQIAPISTNMVLAYVGQHVLGMERSY
jgi:acyl-CoA dehydrogenase